MAENPNESTTSLSGRIAVVTGAGRGIGREEALHLAERGAAVIVNDVEPDLAKEVVDEIVAAGGAGSVHAQDVSTWAGAESLVNQAIDEHGRLDIVVNNAGILRDAMSFSMSEQDWDDVIRVHLKGHAAMAHFAGAHWRGRAKAGEDVSGRIINTTSESGLFGLAGQVNYAAAKAGIASMTIVLGRELEKYGVTVNAIAPRARTRMTETVLSGIGPNEDGFDEWHPANIAPVVAWLASDAAADVTGQVFVIFADHLYLLGGWGLEGRIDGGGRFTVDELAARKDELFGGRRSGIPGVGFGE